MLANLIDLAKSVKHLLLKDQALDCPTESEDFMTISPGELVDELKEWLVVSG